MEGLDLERWNIDFSVAKSLRYHAYRRSFWDRWDSLSKMLTIISGTAVLVTLVGKFPAWSTAMAIIVAVTSSADLVLGFSKKSRDHSDLYRQFSILAQDIAAVDEPTKSDIIDWRRRRLQIEMDEPFVIDLLERRCSGEEADARGCSRDPAWNLSPIQTLLAQWSFWPATRRDQAPAAC